MHDQGATPGSEDGNAPAPVRATNWRSFLVLWFGQTISAIGTNATYYGLGIWTFRETGSTSALSLVILAALFPQLLVLPFTGALIDRYDRRRLMLVSDSGAALATGLLVILFATGRLSVVALWVFVALGSVFQGIQAPAVNAVATQLIEPDQRGRAAGLSQVGRAVPTVFGPIVAGTMISLLDIAGVFAVDLATFAVAVSTLWVLRIPATQRTVEGTKGLGSVRSEAVAALRYLRGKPGLWYLIVYVSLINFALAFFNVYIFPVLLGATSGDEQAVGVIAGVGSIGMIAGAGMMSVWGGPRRRMPMVYGGGLVMAFGMIAFGVGRSTVALAAALFVLFFALAVGNANTQPIWQTKVEEDLQGRVFSIRRLASAATMPVAYLLAGPFVDGLLVPVVDDAEGGLVQSLVGSGPGRAAALGIVLIAMVGLASTVWGMANPRLRNVEHDLPDVA